MFGGFFLSATKTANKKAVSIVRESIQIQENIAHLTSSMVNRVGSKIFSDGIIETCGFEMEDRVKSSSKQFFSHAKNKSSRSNLIKPAPSLTSSFIKEEDLEDIMQASQDFVDTVLEVVQPDDEDYRLLSNIDPESSSIKPYEEGN